MVLLEAGALPHRKFLSLWKLPELRGIEVTSEHVTLGALTTYSEIRRHEILDRDFPLLCRAAAETGGVATQNRGTLGGNIANASPAADSPPALFVYDAEIELVSARGSRWVPYVEFWTGYKQLDLGPDELIHRIRLPRDKSRWKQYYRKVGTRRAQAISKICFAAAAQMNAGRIGQTLSHAIVRAAQEALAREIAPIDDMRSTARYRRRVAQNLLAEFCESVQS